MDGENGATTVCSEDELAHLSNDPPAKECECESRELCGECYEECSDCHKELPKYAVTDCDEIHFGLFTLEEAVEKARLVAADSLDSTARIHELTYTAIKTVSCVFTESNHSL